MSTPSHLGSGPEVHPAQADEGDPPSAPTGILLVVGTAILVVIVFFLEVLHAQYLGIDAGLEPARPTPAAVRAVEEQGWLERGQVPDPPPPEQPSGRFKRGKPLQQAMDEVVRQYGRGS
ncbi:MAG: hypothetical protein KIT58_01950 [Planctomycetota bacterium]|nr:hypothetical protein [Planctomycetota bacterium]